MSPAPHSSRGSHLKALWALCWRMVLLTPIVALFGPLALVTVLALTLCPPVLAVILAISGDYLWAMAAVAGWFAWLRYGGPVRRFVFEGFEHGGI